MTDAVSHHRLKLWIMFSAAHAVCTAILWVWTLAATGLGFKDKSAWTMFDHFQGTVIPAVTSIITTPARFVITDGWIGFLLPLIANSLLWGACLMLIYVMVRRRAAA